MKTAITTMLSLLATLTAATTAHADLASEAQAAHRGELSQIGGMPVPVGDHNQYYYGGPRVNVSVNPLGWMIGAYSASASVAITDHVVLRGDGTYYDIVDSDTHGFQLGLSAPIYFRRAYQGVFLEPGVMIRSLSHGAESYTDDTFEVGPEILLGWHWTWDSGLNVAIAAGLGRNLSSPDDTNGDGYANDDPVFVDGYLRFGYAF